MRLPRRHRSPLLFAGSLSGSMNPPIAIALLWMSAICAPVDGCWSGSPVSADCGHPGRFVELSPCLAQLNWSAVASTFFADPANDSLPPIISKKSYDDDDRCGDPPSALHHPVNQLPCAVRPSRVSGPLQVVGEPVQVGGRNLPVRQEGARSVPP